MKAKINRKAKLRARRRLAQKVTVTLVADMTTPVTDSEIKKVLALANAIW
jgi:hypothetical protein